MSDFKQGFMDRYLEDVIQCLRKMQADLAPFEHLTEVLLDARARGATIFLMGNGGSASTASHFASDLAKGTISEGAPRFRAISLADNIPQLLAWANDASYEDIFVEQLKNLLSPGDVVIGISGSGNSPNVLKAVRYAKEQGATTIGLTGFKGGKLATLADLVYVVPLHYMQQIEDIHLLIEHMITSAIREEAGQVG
ncbi:MAG: SIS domain-containing protein [Candidatus Thermoplasmatota archaeon]